MTIEQVGDQVGEHIVDAPQDVRPPRHEEADSRALASRFVADVLGLPSAVLQWDDLHHLRGHTRVGDREYVLIAPRDSQHEPLMMEKSDWDHVSRATGEQRKSLLRAYTIRHASQICQLAVAC